MTNIRNHQWNYIKKQIGNLQNACQTASDPKVVASVRYSVQSKIMELLSESPDIQQLLLDPIASLNTADDFREYLSSAEMHLAEFPQLTEKQIRKLFPKNKKLALPDLSVDYRFVTYLGWVDISSTKLFIVYPLDGQVVGIEGKYTPTHKKSVCFLCNRHSETALFTAVSKARPAHASPDYYKAVGNYMCLDSRECNKHITNVDALEKFIRSVIGT